MNAKGEPNSILITLATNILSDSRKLHDAVGPPSFLHDTLGGLTEEHEKVRKSLLKNLEELSALVRGAEGRIMTIASQHMDQCALHVAYHFKLAQLVPLDKDISFANLAEMVHCNRDELVRVLRYLMTINIFRESRQEHVAHTADSHFLATNSGAFDTVGYILEDFRPPTYWLPHAMQKPLSSRRVDRTAFNLAFNTNYPYHGYISLHPQRKRRAQVFMKETTRLHMPHIASCYPWDALGFGSTIVDVGGGGGYASAALAIRHPGLRFVVQDISIAQGEADLPYDLQQTKRITFMLHDFRQTQEPAQLAGATFFFMGVMHTLSDEDFIRVLRNLEPALGRGGRVLICDQVLPENGVKSHHEKDIRMVDICMLALVNGRERTRSEVCALCRRADDRFRAMKWYQEEDCPYALCEVVWSE